MTQTEIHRKEHYKPKFRDTRRKENEKTTEEIRQMAKIAERANYGSRG